jgi:hypothetical protein
MWDDAAMALFHVFVDGPVERSSDGFDRLARAMHRRYGLPLAGLVARLQKGRFRVKANIDRRTADAYARDLERIGARVVIEEVGAAGTASPARATPPAGVPYAPALAPSASAPATPGELSTFDLGEVDASLLELAGDDGASAAAVSAKDAPLDLFEPPEVGEVPGIELAPDELAHQARKRAATPLPVPAASPAPAAAAAPAASATAPLQRRSQPAIESPAPAASAPASAPPAPVIIALRAPMPRARFAAGVVLAVLLGFIPAHVVASIRERSAFREIDDHVVQVQSRTDEPLDAAALEAFRAEQKSRKQSQQRSIALASLAIWALAGGGLAYVWFRRVPWDRLLPAR